MLISNDFHYPVEQANTHKVSSEQKFFTLTPVFVRVGFLSACVSVY